LQGYRAILDSLKRPVDPPMLYKVLLALRGTILHQIVSTTRHAELIHLIFRLDSTKPSKHLVEEQDDSKLLQVYKDGSILLAHLHLIRALVSAQSVHLVPALNAVWKLLTKDPSLESFK